MKLIVDKSNFLKSWNLAEKSAGSGSSMNILSTVRLVAGENGVELQATDIKTSIICASKGVTVQEPGEVIFPVKGVSDLFRKAATPEFTLQVDDRKVTMVAGRSRYKFSTYPALDFPKLPTSSSARLFCTIKVSDLSETMTKGIIGASQTEEFPQYLSSAYFCIDGGELRIVSTDNRRLALSKIQIDDGLDKESILLPIKSIKELERILDSLEPESSIKILVDDAQAYFSTEGIEFAVRRIESKFPPYERILPAGFATTVAVARDTLMPALERIDVVVRDYNRMVVLKLSPDDAECNLSGRAPEFGEAVEDITAEISGSPLRIGVNLRFFQEALKVLKDDAVSLSFNGPEGHMAVKALGSDDFICLVAPVTLEKETEKEQDEEAL